MQIKFNHNQLRNSSVVSSSSNMSEYGEDLQVPQKAETLG
jgi:hypothetical protein